MQIATKERPILFSGPMVRAILEGRKTQTRRIIKPQPPVRINELHGGELSTYGKIGDRLRISEEVTVKPVCEDWYSVYFHADGSLLERACDLGLMEKIKGYKSGRLRGVHLPPAYARDVTLEITGVRVERLQDISQPDIAAEGIDCHPTLRQRTQDCYRNEFRELWQSINGPDSWAANPWVWVIEFSRV